MKDYIIGYLLYMPPFVLPLAGGIAGWVALRTVYARTVYGGLFRRPGLIDVSLLFVCIYLVHLLLAQ